MTQKLHTYEIELEAITPLFVGAGQESQLSPYTDFVQDGDTLFLIDAERLEQALGRQPALVDEYVEGVRRRIDNTRSTFELADFIRHRLGTTPEALSRRRLTVRGDLRHNHIRRHIANAGTPYVPGSSIKGALRTAVLFNWLIGEAGKATRQRIEQLVRQKDWRELKHLRVQEACFGRISDDVFRRVRVTDTNPAGPEDVTVSEVLRVPLRPARGRREDGSIPQWSETLRRGTRLSFRLTLEPPAGTAPMTGFDFINGGDIGRLFRQVNVFSRASAGREADVLDRASNNALQKVYDFYDGLYRELEDLPDSAAILRLGGGKTYFDQSIGLAFDTEEAQDFLLDFLKLLRVGRNIDTLDEAERFPKTRSLVCEYGQPVEPLGWVRLTLVS